MAHQDALTQTNADPGSLSGFFRSRWRGEAPLATLFWRDMVLVATAISLGSTVVALAMLALDVPLAVVLATHFAPLPYNIFLFLAVWRTSGRIGGWTAQLAPLGAAAWLAVATVL
jgi:hypothetical protein